jgi:hypothetical protein
MIRNCGRNKENGNDTDDCTYTQGMNSTNSCSVHDCKMKNWSIYFICYQKNTEMDPGIYIKSELLMHYCIALSNYLFLTIWTKSG